MSTTSQVADATRARPTLYVTAAVLSLIGLADSVYLTVEHLVGENAGCVVARGCAEVLGSKYASIGPLPIALIGALAYFIAFSLALLAAFIAYRLTMPYAFKAPSLSDLVSPKLGRIGPHDEHIPATE